MSNQTAGLSPVPIAFDGAYVPAWQVHVNAEKAIKANFPALLLHASYGLPENGAAAPQDGSAVNGYRSAVLPRGNLSALLTRATGRPSAWADEGSKRLRARPARRHVDQRSRPLAPWQGLSGTVMLPRAAHPSYPSIELPRTIYGNPMRHRTICGRYLTVRRPQRSGSLFRYPQDSLLQPVLCKEMAADKRALRPWFIESPFSRNAWWESHE